VSSCVVGSSLTKLLVCSEDDVHQLRNPVQCTLDPITIFILKKVIDVLLLFLAVMVNSSLHKGCLPASQKCTVITPLLRKLSMDVSQLKNYRPASKMAFMSKESVKALVHSIINSRLNYCNSLLYSISDKLLQKLQVIQNAAASVVTRARKFDHNTPVQCELNSLPICQRIRF